jgi:hypothetical protein
MKEKTKALVMSALASTSMADGKTTRMEASVSIQQSVRAIFEATIEYLQKEATHAYQVKARHSGRMIFWDPVEGLFVGHQGSHRCHVTKAHERDLAPYTALLFQLKAEAAIHASKERAKDLKAYSEASLSSLDPTECFTTKDLPEAEELIPVKDPINFKVAESLCKPKIELDEDPIETIEEELESISLPDITQDIIPSLPEPPLSDEPPSLAQLNPLMLEKINKLREQANELSNASGSGQVVETPGKRKAGGAPKPKRTSRTTKSI